MSTIVTQNFKKEFMLGTIRSINTASENYYIGVSQSEAWNAADSAPPAKDTIDIQNDFRNGLQAVHRIAAASLVAPRYSWKTGKIYQRYDDIKTLSDFDSDMGTVGGVTTSGYYVITDNNGVYICLRQGTNASGVAIASTVKPTGSNNDPFETSDGYVWKFLYTVSALDATLFMTNDFIPVTRQAATDSNSTGNEIKQYQIQTAAKPGMITSFDLTNGGTGYTNPKLAVNDVVQDSSVIDFTVAGGVIKKIEYHGDSSTLSYIHGLRGAKLTVTDSNGSNASVRAIMSSGLGIGGDPTSDLKSGSMMIGVRLDGDVDDFLINQDYRQIGIIRGIKDSSAGTEWTSITGGALRSMTINESVAFTKDQTLIGSTSGAKALIDDATSGSPKTILYHQNDSTGYVAFAASETITEQSGSGNGTIISPLIAPEVEAFTGDVLYVDNRAPVTRVANQTEDIKIVIKLDECS